MIAGESARSPCADCRASWSRRGRAVHGSRSLSRRRRLDDRLRSPDSDSGLGRSLRRAGRRAAPRASRAAGSARRGAATRSVSERSSVTIVIERARAGRLVAHHVDQRVVGRQRAGVVDLELARRPAGADRCPRRRGRRASGSSGSSPGARFCSRARRSRCAPARRCRWSGGAGCCRRSAASRCHRVRRGCSSAYHRDDAAAGRSRWRRVPRRAGRARHGRRAQSRAPRRATGSST